MNFGSIPFKNRNRIILTLILLLLEKKKVAILANVIRKENGLKKQHKYQYLWII
jgi:hypothetical protein